MKANLDIKNIDTYSSCASEKEEDILIDKDCNNKEKKMFMHLSYKKQNRKPIEITEVKNFPTYFFICFIFVLCVLMFKFAPDFYGIANKHSKYKSIVKNKYRLKYFSEFFSELDVFSKIGVMISQFLLYSIILSLSYIVKKSSVILKNRTLYFSINILSFISVLTIFALTYFAEYFEVISSELKLVDNILCPIYMIFTFFLCISLHHGLSKIKKREFEVAQSDPKIFFVILMGMQTFLYISSLILVSYYPSSSNLEKFLQFILVICINSNSILFMLTFTFYIFFLKDDLTKVFLNLQYQCENEFYIDIDEDTKNVL